MTAQIIEFSQARHSAPVLAWPVTSRDLRKQRWDVWRKAEAATEYWLTFERFALVVLRVRMLGMSESLPGWFKEITEDTRYSAVCAYREAEAVQMLTPAHNAADLRWKRAALARREWAYTEVAKEQIERAIAADVVWLKAHQRRDKAPPTAD